MLTIALDVLKKINNNGFEAYIVGGYARDMYLGIDSLDIDICTSATPKKLIGIFKNSNLKNESYGSLTVFHKNIRFEITTFRKELKYKDARKPIEIEYINDFEEDLYRRDFIMNTLCLTKNGEFIDKLGARQDIDNKIIRTVGNPDKKFKEDALRILRAIRFMGQLNFDLETETEQAIINNKQLLELLTNHRKKQELESIFISSYSKKAIDKIVELDLEKHLGVSGLKDIVIIKDTFAMWSQLDVDIDSWPFTKNEKENILLVKRILNNNEINDYDLYTNGLYICSVVAKIKGMDYKELIKRWESLPIKRKKDINITPLEIAKALNIKPSEQISHIMKDLETQIVYKKLTNSKEKIIQYIKEENEKDK